MSEKSKECIASGEGWSCSYPIQVFSREMCRDHARQLARIGFVKEINRRGFPGQKYPCKVPNCSNVSHGRRYCHAHLKRSKLGLDMDEEIRGRGSGRVVYVDCRECGDYLGDIPQKVAVARGLCFQCRKGERMKIVGKYGITAARAGDLKTKYRITVSDFEKLFQSQGECCAGCGTKEPSTSKKTWSIDHDHSCCPGGGSCGKCVRGILCTHCNLALGCVKDSKETLTNLINYLDNNNFNSDRKGSNV